MFLSGGIYFHTIKSILNLPVDKIISEIETDFHTIKSILNR